MATRLGAYGGPRAAYDDSFAPKNELVVPKSGDITRLGLYGGPRAVYDDTFAPKTQGAAGPSVKKVRRFIQNVSRMGLR